MSNGLEISTLAYPDGAKKFLITMFIDDKDSAWVEFNKEQLEGLIAMCQKRLTEYNNHFGIET